MELETLGIDFGPVASQACYKAKLNTLEKQIRSLLPKSTIVKPRLRSCEDERFYHYICPSFIITTLDGFVVIDANGVDRAEFFCTVANCCYYYFTTFDEFLKTNLSSLGGTKLSSNSKLYFSSYDLACVFDLMRREIIKFNQVTDFQRIRTRIRDHNDKIVVIFIFDAESDTPSSYTSIVMPNGNVSVVRDGSYQLLGKIIVKN